MPVADREGLALVQKKPLETLVAADIMSAKPMTVDMNTPIDEIMKVLQEHHTVRVPVTARFQSRTARVLDRADDYDDGSRTDDA